MTKRLRRALPFVVVFLCLGVVFWARRHPKEPVFEGKTLSFWLHQYSATMVSGVMPSEDPKLNEMNKQAVMAVRAIGTNAIPALVRMLHEKDSSLVTKIRRLAQKQNLVRVTYRSAYDKHWEAAAGFEILGAPAQQATPALAEIFEENVSRSSVAAAGSVLRGLGPAASGATPFLLRAATNSDPDLRYNALSALSTIAPAEAMLPLLIRSLSDTNLMVQLVATVELGNCGTTAVQAVPVLVQLTTNANSRLRASACAALGSIRSAPEAVPALTARLNDPDAHVRRIAAFSLGNFGAEARKALPALAELLHDRDSNVRAAADRAIKQIDHTSNARPAAE